MATFIDEDFNNPQEDEEENLPNEEGSEETQEDESNLESEEDEIPEKYKGKSVKDIVRMHQEAEKAMGKQGSEVGELRRIVDDFVKVQTVSKQQQAPEVDEDIDFFSDPDKAIAKAISKHPKVQQAEQMAAQMAQTKILATLKTNHPDYEQIIKDSSFAEWIGKSKVRTELFSRADRNYDYDAADELLTTWKERTQVVNKTTEAEKLGRKQAVKAASTGSTKGSGETASKKTYKRADIIELMRFDPDRYQALAPEIMQAYAEGRVK